MVKGQWKFDGSVAETFYEHAKKHIPDYEKVIELCVDVARRRLPSDAKILDVGSAV